MAPDQPPDAMIASAAFRQTAPPRRILALWLPHFAIERLLREMTQDMPQITRQPFATIEDVRGKLFLVAVNGAAARAGLSPGMVLADARAVVPGLITRFANPEGDEAALSKLALWCVRYTPLVSVVGGGQGLFLDITGCAHLFGGEPALADNIIARLAGFGLSARLAIAGTAGAAWAIVTEGDGEAATITGVDDEDTAWAALASLPVTGLRIDAATCEALAGFGLYTIGALRPLPRHDLAARFGEGLVRRLDEALGRSKEPVDPVKPAPAFAARRAFFEPVATPGDIAAITRALLDDLCAGLAAAGRGALRLVLVCHRVDGTAQKLSIGAARPSRWAGPLFRLFAERLGLIDPGFGIEIFVLEAPDTAPVSDEQADWQRQGAESGKLDELIDRLGNRFGFSRLTCPAPFQSWLPERAVTALPPGACLDDMLGKGALRWPGGRARPVKLLARPEPVEAIAPVPDDPPVQFYWQGRAYRVRAADGPERLCGEWWRDESASDDAPKRDYSGRDYSGRDYAARDYYAVEDEAGRRYWLYREGLYQPGTAPKWFLHGFFG